MPDDISTFYYNIYTGHAPLSGKPFDVVLLWAVLQYVFDDKAIKHLLSHLHCQKLFIRTPIGDGEQIEKYSEELGAMYSSRYFELEPLLDLIGEYFTVQEVARVYPDEIESKFGTKQCVIAAVTK